MILQRDIPIDVAHLLPTLDMKLLDLLKSLKPEERQKQIIAKLWTVKDVVAHLAGLMPPKLYYPFIDIFMLALPYTYRLVPANNGSIVKVTIPTAIGGAWYLLRTNDRWKLKKDLTDTPTAEIIIDPDISWRLFSKGLSAEQVKEQVKIHGNEKLGSTVLTMLSVIHGVKK